MKKVIREMFILSIFLFLGITSFLIGFHFRTSYLGTPIGDIMSLIGGSGFLLAIIGYPFYLMVRIFSWYRNKKQL